ncbi:LytTR family DNA-binding domain-containing protein [Lactiplantibacillus plantarum]
MKINFHIDPNLKDEHVDFWLHHMTDHISNITSQLNLEQEILWCYQDKKIKPVNYKSILVLQTVGTQIEVKTTDNVYYCKSRISQLIEQLPSQFIESARGTIINYKKIDHLELLDNGKIDVIMTNNERVQISRRKIKNLKEKLGI